MDERELREMGLAPLPEEELEDDQEDSPVLLAESTMTITKELFSESFSVVFDKRQQKMLVYCGVIFGVVGIILMVAQLWLTQSLPIGMPVLLTGCGVLIWAAVLPRSECKRKFKALKYKSGGDLERTVQFYEELLTVSCGESVLTDVDYTEIREIRETEHLAVLLCQGKTGVLVAKDGFTRGSLDEIKAAIALQRG